jgi:hypothetical protein
LFATKDEDLEGDEDNTRMKATTQEMNTWRRKGPLGKLHNINKWIFGSDLRLSQFLTFSNRRIPRDNSTRWNSWQREISVALNPEIRGAIHSFIQNYGDKDILEDLLSNEDWDQLESINQMLTVLQQSTKSLEGSFASLYKVIPAMDFILQHFEQGRQDHSGTLMAPLYQSGWEKMRKYYNLLESTPAYVAAIVLHPGYKWDYIKAEWDPEWVVKSEVIHLSL